MLKYHHNVNLSAECKMKSFFFTSGNKKKHTKSDPVNRADGLSFPHHVIKSLLCNLWLVSWCIVLIQYPPCLFFTGLKA